jgi:hypothetical protein
MNSRERLAQVYGRGGALVATTPALAHTHLLTAAEARRAGRGLLRVPRVDTPAGPTAVRARPAHAFERFSRREPARPGGGTGLGLPIVATIAEAHGGEAGARNLPGSGADVWLSVPAA